MSFIFQRSPQQLDRSEFERMHSDNNATSDAPILSTSREVDSAGSSPAIPLSTPVSSPGLLTEVTEVAGSSVHCGEGAYNAQTSVPVIELANVMRLRLSKFELESPSSPLPSPSKPKLAQSLSLLSSPRMESESREGSPFESTHPCHPQRNTARRSAHVLSGDLCESVENEADIVFDNESKTCTLQGSALSANGSKVTWVYHGFVNGNKLPQGRGTRTFSNGEIFDGSWSAGVPHGAGRTLHADGAV